MDTERGDMMASRLRQSHGVDAAGYARDVQRVGVFFRRNYLRHMPRPESGTVLEMGCGLGQFLAFCRGQGYGDLLGIDLAPSNIEFCRGQGYDVDLQDGFEFLGMTDRVFSAIVLNDVIEHIPKDRVVPLMERALSRLLPGGVLIMKTINAANPLLGAHSRYADFTHETSWTEESMREMLERSGFSTVEVYPSNLYVFYANPLNWVAWGVATAFELFFYAYFQLHGRATTRIFTKNLIAVARKK